MKITFNITRTYLTNIYTTSGINGLINVFVVYLRQAVFLLFLGLVYVRCSDCFFVNIRITATFVLS